MLSGTPKQPHLLLRFNTLSNHQWNTNAIVQFIIHDGRDFEFRIFFFFMNVNI
jgi:hypothetical protein